MGPARPAGPLRFPTIMRRPSPALVVAVVALVVSCAGSAGATILITSKDVKDGSLQGKDIRANTITGRNVKGLSGRDVLKNGLDGSDIDEATLDTVPSATNATRATTAGTADTLRGVHFGRAYFKAGSGTTATTVYDEGGIRVQAACGVGGVLAVNAVPSGSADGLIRVTVIHPGSPAQPTYVTDNDFVGTDSANLVAGGADNASGHLVFTSPAGDTVTMDYLAQGAVDPARGFACLFTGTAIHTTA